MSITLNGFLTFAEALERHEEELVTKGLAVAADLITCAGDRAVLMREIDKRIKATMERFG